jgi:hypothetical protein
MIAAWVLALALQADPVIEKVEPIVGSVRRPMLWTPLRVTISSPSDFTGDLVARSGFGFSVARAVSIKAGGRDVILLPAIDPAEIRIGRGTFRPSGNVVRPDRIVIVDARLPYASELVSTEKVLVQKVPAEELARLLPRGLLEAADLVLVPEPVSGGTVAPTREAADRAVAAVVDRPPSLEVADRAVWPLAPRENWVPTKKNWALYFATVYLFAAFVALTVVAKRFPKFGLASVAGVAVVGIAGYAAFPRSQMWIVGQSAEVVSPAGDAREHRIWFLQSALELTVDRIEFPRLVKPVFPSAGGTDDAFTIRVDERGCSVEGLKLVPGRAACFGGEEGKPSPTMRVDGKVEQPLRSAVIVRSGRAKFLGDLAAGAPLPADPGEGGIPPGPEFEAWKRFVGGDGLFGVLPKGERPFASVKSRDLADEVDRPPVYVQRFK